MTFFGCGERVRHNNLEREYALLCTSLLRRLDTTVDATSFVLEGRKREGPGNEVGLDALHSCSSVLSCFTTRSCNLMQVLLLYCDYAMFLVLSLTG